MIKYLILALLFVPCAWAKTMPAECVEQDFNFVGNELLFNVALIEPVQYLYAIYNKSAETVILAHEDTNPFVDIGWKSTLESKKMSALAVDENNFVVTCYQGEAESQQQVDCVNYLEVCRFTVAKFALSSQGSFLLAENTSLKEIIRAAGKNGVRIPKW